MLVWRLDRFVFDEVVTGLEVPSHHLMTSWLHFGVKAAPTAEGEDGSSEEGGEEEEKISHEPPSRAEVAHHT